MRNVRAVWFDLDDTLFPERDFVASGFRAIDTWLIERLGVRGFFDRAWARHSKGDRGHVFDDVLADLGVAKPGLVQQLVDTYRSHVPTDLALYPDAALCLSRLKQQGYWLGLLTDGYLDAQRGKVAALGLTNTVRDVVFSDELGRSRWKPDPAPFQEAERRSGYRSGACAYVGDNPKKDFMGARACGWRTIRVRRPHGEYSALDAPEGMGADHDVTSLEEIPECLG